MKRLLLIIALLICIGLAVPSSAQMLIGSNTSPLINLCTGGTAISDGDYSPSFAASYAFDGNTGGTQWASLYTDLPHYIGYHFVSAVQVVHVKVYIIYYISFYGSNFTVDYSNDGSSWTTQATKTLNDCVTTPVDFTFTNTTQNHTYWRINFTSPAACGGITWMQVSEVQMFSS